MSRRLTNDEFLAKVAKLQPDVEVLDTYVTSSTRMRARCKRCGREWEADGGSLARGNGCIRCASVDRISKRRITTEDFRAKLSNISPDIEVVGEYKSSTEKIHVKCLTCGHEWLSLPSNLLAGHGCRECMRINTGARCKSTHAEFIKKLSRIHPEFKCVDDKENLYSSSIDHMQFKCPNGHIFSARPDHILHPMAGCPVCKESYGEQKIRRYLEDNGIPFESQKTFADCVYIRALPFDFYIEELNTAIEFDGHHHFAPIKHFGGEEHFEATRLRDDIKTKYCRDNGIVLVRIPYWDYDNIERTLDAVINSRKKESEMKNLIKVVSPEVAEQLAKLGFQYIKEGSVFAFIQTDELMSVLQQTYSNGAFICENKLRF